MSAAMKKVSIEARKISTDMYKKLLEITGEHVDFSLFFWTEGRCTYISNCPDRTEIIDVLEGLIAEWKLTIKGH